MTDVHIAPAVETHLAEIPRIEAAAATVFSEVDLPQSLRFKVTEPDDLRDALDDERLWVATTVDERIAGYALADVVDQQAYLAEVDVLPEYFRQGIGTKLVNTVVNWATTQGFESLWLVTFRHLPWNAPFYEKLGFSLVNPAEHGKELASLIEEEGRLGINVSDRVAMRILC